MGLGLYGPLTALGVCAALLFAIKTVFGALVQPLTKQQLASGAPRPPSLYAHNTQTLTAQNVHAQANALGKNPHI